MPAWDVMVMKVLHLISGGDTGGAKTHVLTLLMGLKRLGVEVELLCIMEGVFTQEAAALGIPVKLIRQPKRYDLSVHKRIIEYINSADYDLLHCHGARANYIAFFIRHKIHIPMLTTLHSDYKLDFKDSLYKQIVFAPINAVALRSFQYILTVTESFKKMLIKRGFDDRRLFVIYNGVDFEFRINIVPKRRFLGLYNIPCESECVYVGIAARFQAVKGVFYFLKAAEIVCRKRKNVRFLIAGNGDQEKEIKKFIDENGLQDRVFMLGYVNDINSFYNAIDINTLTSLSESFPYSLLEGARMKKATIATAVGGIPEMIKDGETGFLVEVRSAEEIADKILELSEDAALREKFGDMFYKFASENFSAEKMAWTHIRIYEKILEENSN